MTTVTVAEMKEIERKADEAGLPYYDMMENAGKASYEVIKSKFPNAESLIIFCGKGNNGGDGLVVARLAAKEGKKVCVILVEGIPATTDALTNYNKLLTSIDIKNLVDIKDSVDIKNLVDIKDSVDTNSLDCINLFLGNCSDKCNATNAALHNQLTESINLNTVIVDALYGTGFHGSLRENAKLACNMINSFKQNGCPIVALDIPSGCSADDRAIANGAVNADITIVFHSYKNVHVPPVINCGECVLVDIGIQEIGLNMTPRCI